MMPKTDSKSKVTAPDMLTMYKEMLFYRRFEERANIAYTKQKFSGFLHLHIGQEAVCVGVQHAMNDQDYCISAYRSHTQAIAKGIPAEQVFSELFGKATGCSRGKGGSMHMFSKEKRFFGGHGIVGAQAPIAVGTAFAIKYKEESAVMVCYLGDAAMNQGQVFEAMNMAATWSLPVLFVIENNQYGMGTEIHRTTSVDHLYKRALAFDMDHSQVDGMNCMTVYGHMKPIIDQMRQDRKPHLAEVLTYRYKGHSVSDPATYRTKEEVQEYQKQDPITQLGALLVEQSLASNEDLKTWDKEAKEQVKSAEQIADKAPAPSPDEVWLHVFG
ncbi:MAG: pyruvate dehydrogenase (acetyl-transferring) E1 component subunit alpha [Oligoflexales bacterium]